jgi:hypothetical protein
MSFVKKNNVQMHLKKYNNILIGGMTQKELLNSLMQLVDANSENIKEDDYIKMCDIMKNLYDTTIEENSVEEVPYVFIPQECLRDYFQLHEERQELFNSLVSGNETLRPRYNEIIALINNIEGL